jgi:16S rRNA C967 or C1407 C5-methylase (RsmB/RsmF family)
MKSTFNKGKTAFLEYYSQLLPQFSNPEDLEKYLSKNNPPVILVSSKHQEEIKKLWEKEKLDWKSLDWFPWALEWPKGVPIGTPLPGFKEGWLYALNRSSLLPVVALDPHPGEAILDACAAPGGKTAAIANIVGDRAFVMANDASMPRFKRLRTVLKFFGSPDITTTNFSVQALTHTSPTTFDKILLDAPCSSEKHVFNSKKHLKIWSPNRSKTLAHIQEMLIDSLLPLLNTGGKLVYSTCALTPAENEEVITATLKKHPELKLSRDGMQRVNDFEGYFDPMFVATLTRKD